MIYSPIKSSHTSHSVVISILLSALIVKLALINVNILMNESGFEEAVSEHVFIISRQNIISPPPPSGPDGHWAFMVALFAGKSCE